MDSSEHAANQDDYFEKEGKLETHGPPRDPNGPPQPAEAESTLGAGSALGIVIVAGGTAFVMMSTLLVPVNGATRSAHLVWEQRQQEIDAAIAAQSALCEQQPLADQQNVDQPSE